MKMIHSTPPAVAVRILVVGVLVLVPACGDSRFQKTYKVSGSVLVDGKPVKGVAVRFLPRDKSKFQMEETPQGTTDGEGRFTLSTYYTGDGAPPGDYLVAIAEPDQQPAENPEDDTNPFAGGKKPMKSVRKVPPLYQNPQKSGLTVAVPRQDSVLPPFELSWKKK